MTRYPAGDQPSGILPHRHTRGKTFIMWAWKATRLSGNCFAAKLQPPAGNGNYPRFADSHYSRFASCHDEKSAPPPVPENSVCHNCGISCLPQFANAWDKPSSVNNHMQFGLVTYLWGKDVDAHLTGCLREIGNQRSRTANATCTWSRTGSIESAACRVKKRFADSPVELVGYGSNAQYHENDPARLKANIALTKDYLRLMHDCGGTGQSQTERIRERCAPRENSRTITALNEVAKYGQALGQQAVSRFMAEGQVNYRSFEIFSQSQRIRMPLYAGTPTMWI